MTVRDATAADVADVRRVVEASWKADYPDVLSRESIEAGIDEWYGPGRLRDEVARARTLLLVAEDADEVVGFVHGLWTGSDGDILRLYVHPDRRGEGVGGTLLERARERFAARDVDRIEAMVLTANEPGNEFYRSFGFERVDAGETTIGGERYEENRYELRL